MTSDSTRPDVRLYLKHAKFYGTDCVWETAREEGMGLRDLGVLADRLGDLDRKFRLARADRYWLALGLVNENDPPITHRRVCQQTRISESTLRRLLKDREDAGCGPNQGSQTPINTGAGPVKTSTRRETS